MPTSKPPGSGGGAPGNNNYTRFIPREELGSFAAWSPSSLEDPGSRKPAPGESPAGGGVYKAPFAERAGVSTTESVSGSAATAGTAVPPRPREVPSGPQPAASRPDVGVSKPLPPQPAAAPTPPPPPPVDIEALTGEARHAGYQDGYRDGLAALESFKQTQAAQMAAFMSDQVGSIVNDLHARLESLEQQLSGRIAGVALELARQVVRSEISQRPELVVQVADDALNTLLSSAKQITVNMHPDDFALAKGALMEQLESRGARVVADAHVSPGGCVVSSDIAVVDARVEARWARAAAAMGMKSDWDDGPGTPVRIDDDLDDEGRAEALPNTEAGATR